MKLPNKLKTIAMASAVGLQFGTACAQDAPILTEITDPDERARVEALIEQAREEGGLAWVGSFFEQAAADALYADFKVLYGLPDIEAKYTYEGSSAIPEKVMQPLAAGRNNFDLVSTVNWGWFNDLLAMGELMEYHSPSYDEYTYSNDYGLSRDGYWVSDAYAFTPLYNPAVLAERGVEDFHPTTWAEMNDPRLRGLVSVGNPRAPSPAATINYLIRVMGEEWVVEFIENTEPVINTRSSQSRDWLASGEVPLALLSHAKNTFQLHSTNVDVTLVYPEEGTVLLPQTTTILAAAPHPATARLFIDYMRSLRGTQLLMDSGATLFYGRPGIVSPDKVILPDLGDISIADFNWDTEGANDVLDGVRDKLVEWGLN
jgi:iron(III) transport system substrate-binding protein